ncbi:SICA antigen [Plasmodium coatneyi]|uniref:SICA antigen n=1 Tax=Plasmodium coatneyi TaxID=208452 RepID=A0A1B1DTD0_9APIC|nr:SICA antigen [Plasmodium coatneyi]ANQ05994.1 SICA antigen [Plasmodium coatneyi]
MWGEDDAGKVLKELSTAIKNGSTQDEDSCKNIVGAKGTASESEKKACNLIVKGLKHIYNIKLEYDENNQKNPVQNQQFQQSMACLLLNKYAEQLKTKAKEKKCEIEKGIKHVFDNSEEIKNKEPLCQEKNNTCYLCKQEHYKSCTVEGKNVEDELNKMLKSKEGEIQQTLTNICPTILPIESSTQPHSQHDHQAAKPAATKPRVPAPGHALIPSQSTVPTKEGKNKDKDEENECKNSAKEINALQGSGGYFGMLRKTRKRYRRAYQVRGPTVQEELLGHVDDQADGPHAYTLVKERKPRSTPKKRRKKRVPVRRRRMIIDIHLEVLDECQKGDTKLLQEDFFEILVQEFMRSEFVKEEKVPKDQTPKEQVACSDSGFREGRLCSYGRYSYGINC